MGVSRAANVGRIWLCGLLGGLAGHGKSDVKIAGGDFRHVLGSLQGVVA